MYSYEDRKVAIELYIKYDLQVNPVIKELGYPSRRILYKWYKEYLQQGSIPTKHIKRSSYSDEQKRIAIDYYFAHGKTLANTIRKLGYPTKITLRTWIDELSLESTKRCETHKYSIRYPEDQKKQAVMALYERNSSVENIAKAYGVPRTTLYEWKKQLLGTEKVKSMISTTRKLKLNADSKSDETTALAREIERLKKEVFELQLERDILLKATELLKKEMSINPISLSNKEKAILIDALKSKYKLKILLSFLDMAKSSYFYHETIIKKADKYLDIRSVISEIFNTSGRSYGYRRIHMSLKNKGIHISEKVVRKIMHEDQLFIPTVKRRKYNSYKGEISPATENLLNRNFYANKPNEKWLTDITEFHIPAGKVYLSPIIDCFDGMVVTWSVGTSPDSNLVNSMLDEAITLLNKDEHPIIHSDRGCHYRWPGWIERISKAKMIRSMSQKGCSPDNAACEGFFGRLKNEMYYGKPWHNVTLNEFMNIINEYIQWYNEKRIKVSLGGLSPINYRRKLGLLI